MFRPFTLLRLFCVLCVLVVSSSTVMLSARAASAHHNVVSSSIQHIVFIMKENHTFDSLFGSFPGANGATTGIVKVNGVDVTIPLNAPQNVPDPFCHTFACATKADDSGLMDAFNQADAKRCGTAPYACYQMGTQALIPNYWQYAQQYVLGDNTWSSLRGPSFPNHLYMMAAASGPNAPHSVVSNAGSTWGCDAVSTARTRLLDGEQVFPCFSFPTLADEMQTAGVSWKYYAPKPGEGGYIWNTANAFSQFRNTSLWTTNDIEWKSFATDAANGTLPAFSWLTPPWKQSEHNSTNVCVGENWTTAQINAVMSGPDWASSVIVVSWDDYGGFYDHVAPQNIDALGEGFRVPLLVISPFTTPHITHNQYEFASVLKLAEEAFHLPSLGQRDVSAGDLMTDLDLTQQNPPLLLQQRTCPTVAVPPAPPAIDD